VMQRRLSKHKVGSGSSNLLAVDQEAQMLWRDVLSSH
jgi:hypothetical protein